MKKIPIQYLDFEIDKLTRSIENVTTGDSFPTEISYRTKADLKSVLKKNGWGFDWKKEFNQVEREVYKLTILNNPNIIQGLLSLSIEEDHVYMHLIESASFNKGKGKVYFGVPGNLVAYACRRFVSFHAKTRLINHYKQSLGAFHFGGNLMIINTDSATKLVDKYFKQ